MHYISNAAKTARIQKLLSSESYSYDHMGRRRSNASQLQDSTNTIQGAVRVSLASYNETGQLIKKGLHSINGTSNFLQNLDYRYNARGWLTNINNPTLTADGGTTNTDLNDQFGMELKYDNATSSRPQYNGNIATTTVKTGSVSGTSFSAFTYDYRYDKLNRLNDAVSTTATTKDGFHSEYVTYDNMGNITNLGRYDKIGPNRTAIDTLTYTYIGNRVDRIDDASAYAGTFGFTNGVSQAGEYTYDGNGNQLKDLNKGLTGFTYNLLNLPQTITRSNGNTTVYIYDATGRKLRKLFTAGATTTTDEYINGIQYEYTGSMPVLAFIQTEEGRARKNGTTYVYEYDLKDHLGNTRITTTWDPADATQLTPKNSQHTDYYAFGYAIQSLQGTISSPKNVYLYNGKELQEETGLYDYGARFYDPVIGRWTSVDPLAEISRRFTPYNYGEDNPIRNIDPDGRSTQDWLDANGLTQNDLITVYQAPAQQEDDPKKKKEQPKSKPNQSKPAPRLNPDWFYSIPVLSEASMTNDSFQNGDYWEAGVHQVTGILESFLFAESEAVSLWDSFTGMFSKKAATTAVDVVAVNGETAATALGRAMHKAYKKDLVDGVTTIKEFVIPNTLKRIDYIDFNTRTIYELKPNNIRALKAGEKQLLEYKRLIEKEFGSGWKTVLDKY
ncbi:hypothetical protein PQ469_22500 [Mucilaginibacter sp. KACC 22773]|uniref:RHS repeat-associated core domain-containing protein n=1 Tax=Mucilaginibacter sp. KACC 22773 TaxID=3025671 RepID=UPI002367390F|nr:RHS repeat-associated core domain-containing protein [Mucilaginibacter sp. KACC 22773]WDF76660.1 hypothetical protein PQ469_22500 [Mucilaginibacter sp. KACC 22773]